MIEITEDQVHEVVRRMGWEKIDAQGFIEAAKFVTNPEYGGPSRSEPGAGEIIQVYVLGRADQHADSVVPVYGKISAGCGPSIGEDFANCRWPVAVKVKVGVDPGDLVQHLRDLADSIETIKNNTAKLSAETDDLPVI